MKVLFAVNDENISTSIVKKYQKQYKEIISYKNVYYFNAILKELQRNKSYDRVVISEDLEEFTSSSIEQKDKFIFDRLDNISDEAVSADGSDIPIILICSERRAKREDILVKLFGIGIYNAIIGDDRRPEEVCRLINKPRSKKEAKLYYSIDSENVNYEKESESEVNEVEMQNILRHFKKLGKNEEKYVESFNNIVSQYNNEQLKVIIAVLPDNVKEILGKSSLEFQRIMYSDIKRQKSTPDTNSKNRASMSKKRISSSKGTSEKLLQTESREVMSKPVVVPSTMEKNMYKKVEPKRRIQVESDIDDEKIEEEIPENQPIIEEKPRKRGRPRKNPIVTEETAQEPAKPKKRGRPRKTPIIEEQQVIEEPTKINTLPGFEDEDDDYDEDISYNKIDNNSNVMLPGFEDSQEDDDLDNEQEFTFNNNRFEQDDENDDYENESENEDYNNEEDDNDYYNDTNTYNTSNQINSNYQNKNQYIEQYDNDFNDGEFESLLAGDKKITAFVGTSKNGTSFIINNIAQILSDMGVDTAILDATQNQNAYYIYTKNDEDLRNIAVSCIDNLIEGRAQGIAVNNNLTVYTTVPDKREQINNSHPILETLLKRHSVILIDCDFNTQLDYFDKAQELYLIQSMDVLTIQPLTAFLNELRVRNILNETKIRIILNKILRVRGVTGKNIIGGMANYNDPEMSFMTELFDKNTVKVAEQIPFDEDVYAKYLENLIECEIKINGYPKEFKNRLISLAQVIYPLLPNTNGKKKNKKESKPVYNQYSNSFSSGMNNTLDNMRKRY